VADNEERKSFPPVSKLEVSTFRQAFLLSHSVSSNRPSCKSLTGPGVLRFFSYRTFLWNSKWKEKH